KLDLAKAILATGSFHWKTRSQFTLASGRVSEYYVNCKQLLSHPQYRRILAGLIADHLKGWDIQAVGGMEIGAIPIATAVSDYVYDRTGRELRTFVVRKKPKDHGMKHTVEGAFESGDRVLVVDDVLTTGQATIDAIMEARAPGGRGSRRPAQQSPHPPGPQKPQGQTRRLASPGTEWVHYRRPSFRLGWAPFA